MRDAVTLERLEYAILKDEDDVISVHMELPTDHIAPGRYHCAALLFEINEYGKQVAFDRVEPAPSFEIHNAENDNLIWLTRYWGNVKLDDVRLMGCNRE